MKSKKMFNLAITALMIASCSNDELTSINNRENRNVIGFDLSTSKCKANVAELVTLQSNIDGFGVFADNGTPSKVFIDNSAYKYDGATNTWIWSNKKFSWPKEETQYPINFYAFYPLSETTLNSTLDANYTVAATPAEQTDLLAANHIGVLTKPASGDVSIAFRHILAKIDFKMVADANVTAEIQSIAVTNVGNNGTFNFATLSWKNPPTTWTSKYDYMKAPVMSANKFAGATDPEKVTGSSGSLMLMPQNIAPHEWDKTIAGLKSQSYIEVVYRLYETVSGKDIVGYSDATKHPEYATLGGSVTGPLFVKVGYSLNTDWVMNKAYVYTISLNENSSGGNLIEENFTDKDGNDSKLPVVNPETEDKIDKPDPIFPDAPIGFIITVEDWGAPIKNLLQ